MDRQYFIKRFNINIDKMNSIGLKWDCLEEIYKDYLKQIPRLNQIAQYLANRLLSLPKVHSVRFRVKESYHLAEKIYRKRIEEKEKIITVENYLEKITDLIGVRALHLFKSDGVVVHKRILQCWDLKETPIVYIRCGDSSFFEELIKKHECEIKEHPFGYRSVHYIIETKPEKTKYYAEIQVRTIFEEGWSEIDHKIRYPYNLDNKLINESLTNLNKHSGSADDMATFIKNLQIDLSDSDINEQKSD